MDRPDFIVKDAGEDRMYRWFLIPRNKWINIYLHKLVKPDPQALHDHEYDNLSIVLRGGYFETTSVDKRDVRDLGRKPTRTRWRPPGSIIARKAEWAHRLSPLYTLRNGASTVVPSWSLFITFRRKRNWGFHTRRGWVAFKDLEAPYEKIRIFINGKLIRQFGVSDVAEALHKYEYGEQDV